MHMPRNGTHSMGRQPSLPQQRSAPRACPGRECVKVLKISNSRSRQSLSMDVRACKDTSVMSTLADEGLSSFAFEMEMDDPKLHATPRQTISPQSM